MSTRAADRRDVIWTQIDAESPAHLHAGSKRVFHTAFAGIVLPVAPQPGEFSSNPVAMPAASDAARPPKIPVNRAREATESANYRNHSWLMRNDGRLQTPASSIAAIYCSNGRPGPAGLLASQRRERVAFGIAGNNMRMDVYDVARHWNRPLFIDECGVGVAHASGFTNSSSTVSRRGINPCCNA